MVFIQGLQSVVTYTQQKQQQQQQQQQLEQLRYNYVTTMAEQQQQRKVGCEAMREGGWDKRQQYQRKEEDFLSRAVEGLSIEPAIALLLFFFLPSSCCYLHHLPSRR
jgi:hypothetical protein